MGGAGMNKPFWTYRDMLIYKDDRKPGYVWVSPATPEHRTRLEQWGYEYAGVMIELVRHAHA